MLAYFTPSSFYDMQAMFSLSLLLLLMRTYSMTSNVSSPKSSHLLLLDNMPRLPSASARDLVARCFRRAMKDYHIVYVVAATKPGTLDHCLPGASRAGHWLWQGGAGSATRPN